MAIEVHSASPVEQSQKHHERAAKQVTEREGSPVQTGFGENAQAMFSRVQREFTSKARYNAEAPIRERNDYIDELIRRNEISQDDLEQYMVQRPGWREPTEQELSAPASDDDWAMTMANAYLHPLGTPAENRVPDYDMLAEYFHDAGYEVSTTEQLNQKIAEDLNALAMEEEDVFSRAGLGGQAGQLGGGFLGGLLDPINIPLMFVPGASARVGASLAANVGRGAAVGAAQNVAVEAAFIAAQEDFRKQYNLAPRDIVEEGPLALAIGAITGSAGGAIGHALNKRLDSPEPPPRVDVDDGDQHYRVELAKTDAHEIAMQAPNRETGVPTSEQLQMSTVAYDARADITRRIDPELDAEIETARARVDALQGFQACLLGND